MADTGAPVVCGGQGVDAGDWAHIGAALANQPDTVHCGQEELECAVQVIISLVCEDGGNATTRDLLYIGEELSSVFISRDALAQSRDHQEGVPKGAPEQ